MNPGITDPAAIGEAIAEYWRTYKDVPYYIGGESKTGMDCSGLVRVGWTAFDVWPFDNDATAIPQDRDATADMIWRACPKVLWDDRRAGDAVCYGGQGSCFHIVGVLDPQTFIGANSGRRKRPDESHEAYVAAMKAADAKVKIVPESYWATRRLGVVRAPALMNKP